MKMKKIAFYTVATLLIMVVGIPVLAGCSKQAQSGASGPANYGARTTGPHYWLTKYDQPVTLHVVTTENATIDFTPGDDMTRNEWTRGLLRDLNINIVTDWVSTAYEYNTRLNLAIASGDLPDVFSVDSTQFKQLREADMLADITDYIENNASNVIKEIMAFSPEILDTAKINGRLVAMPKFGYGSIDKPQLLWLRHDWMESARLAPPKTIAELENLMKTFMAAHPGTYGMSLDKYLSEMTWLGPAFKAYPDTWFTGSDGSIVYGGIQPEMKNLLSTFADWYKKGYFLKDFMSQDSAAVRQDLVSGKFGVQIFAQWWGYGNGADVVKNLGNNAYFEAYEFPTIDGRPAVHPLGFDNGGYIAINKKSKNIDAAIKTMSYIHYINLEVLAQGIMTPAQVGAYLLPSNSGLGSMPMFLLNDPVNEVRAFEQIREAALTGDVSKITSGNTLAKYTTAHDWVTKGDPNGIGNWLQDYADRSAYMVTYNIVKENRFVLSRIMGPVPDEAAGYDPGSGLVEGFTKIIIGQEPVSYFDTLVREWKAAGGDIQTQAINKEYNR